MRDMPFRRESPITSIGTTWTKNQGIRTHLVTFYLLMLEGVLSVNYGKQSLKKVNGKPKCNICFSMKKVRTKNVKILFLTRVMFLEKG